MEVETAAMTHPVETYALGFSAGSKSIVYSGDTTYNKRLPVFAEGCSHCCSRIFTRRENVKTGVFPGRKGELSPALSHDLYGIFRCHRGNKV